MVSLTVCDSVPSAAPGPTDTSTAEQGPRSPDTPLPLDHLEPLMDPLLLPPGSYRRKRFCCKTPALVPGEQGRGRREAGPWWWWRHAPGGPWNPFHWCSHGRQPATYQASPNHLGIKGSVLLLFLYNYIFALKTVKNKSLDLESTYSGKVPDDLIESERSWGGPRPCLSPPAHSQAVWVRTRTREPRKRTDGSAKSPGARCPAAGPDPDYRAVLKTPRDSGPSPSSCATSATPINIDLQLLYFIT